MCKLDINENVEQHAWIKFCVKLKKTFSETKKIIEDGFGRRLLGVFI